jgi:hypothetical protein
VIVSVWHPTASYSPVASELLDSRYPIAGQSTDSRWTANGQLLASRQTAARQLMASGGYSIAVKDLSRDQARLTRIPT